MYIRLHVNFPFSCEILMNSRQICKKKIDKRHIHKNLSSGSRNVPYGQTDMNVTGASRNFVNAPKNTVLKKSCTSLQDLQILTYTILKLGLSGLNVASASQVWRHPFFYY